MMSESFSPSETRELFTELPRRSVSPMEMDVGVILGWEEMGGEEEGGEHLALPTEDVQINGDGGGAPSDFSPPSAPSTQVDHIITESEHQNSYTRVQKAKKTIDPNKKSAKVKKVSPVMLWCFSS